MIRRWPSYRFLIEEKHTRSRDEGLWPSPVWWSHARGSPPRYVSITGERQTRSVGAGGFIAVYREAGKKAGLSNVMKRADVGLATACSPSP